ncbi:50S ribosomal protein L22 [Candidatus Saganbacteria bacterium CG08_land_8_20_14_0_20_45_16]|uniref:Large ribosomal subunit protein uL22 n=1 Tax=Candidatus Saganbacteria bacterium CG08_land_8_20_14_0_20_45_16 TaxID=2014293 RepID=A0A2H0XZK0_UNCSA|nr:MAG: 50S ribosomal protein L22 [Candidatus Saganbacteria bacterium CG08_land_8_20_14_0_20_45_16]
MTRVKAKSKWVRIAPRKVSRIMDLVRGKPVAQAIDMLGLMPHKGAKILKEVIKSAMANAVNNYKLQQAELKVLEVYVNKGVDLKRWRAKARGRVGSILKRTSHLTVFVGVPEVPAQMETEKIKEEN